MERLKQDLGKINPEQLHQNISFQLKSYRKNLKPWPFDTTPCFRQSSQDFQRKINSFKDKPLLVANALMLIHLVGYCDYLKSKNGTKLQLELDSILDTEIKNKIYEFFPNEIKIIIAYFENAFKKPNLASFLNVPILDPTHAVVNNLSILFSEEKNMTFRT